MTLDFKSTSVAVKKYVSPATKFRWYRTNAGENVPDFAALNPGYLPASSAGPRGTSAAGNAYGNVLL
jgi:hypothetical protein